MPWRAGLRPAALLSFLIWPLALYAETDRQVDQRLRLEADLRATQGYCEQINNLRLQSGDLYYTTGDYRKCLFDLERLKAIYFKLMSSSR
jgi:hypothetical protein